MILSSTEISLAAMVVYIRSQKDEWTQRYDNAIRMLQNRSISKYPGTLHTEKKFQATDAPFPSV